MIKKGISPLIGLMAFCCASAWAADAAAPAGALVKRKTPEETIIAKLEQARPDIKVDSVHPSPIAGLYQARMGGGTVLVTADGEKMILGEIYNIGANGIAKWEDPALVAERKKLLSSLDPKDAISFKPEGKSKAVVYVFTDVDCGYCRKLNQEMASYNKLGIEVRYLAFPRAGVPSSSSEKLTTAWCSKDKQKALTQLKEGQDLPKQTCANPVAAQYELGGRVGVNGTPAIWMPNGELKPGYLPADVLAKELGIL
jgi:thiol:disulfide interchange protein DsbC